MSSPVKVYVKKANQEDRDAICVEIACDADVQTLKEAYLARAGGTIPLANLVLEHNGTKISNRDKYQSYNLPAGATLTASHDLDHDQLPGVLGGAATLAPQATVDFWNLLPRATLTGQHKKVGKGKKRTGEDDSKESTFLDLGTGACFLGDDKLGSRMFVRECYSKLAEITIDIVASGYNLVITGNPGIGKSYFLFFFMYFLCTREQQLTIVLFRHLEKRWYLFSKGTVLVAEKAHGQTAFRKYLDDPDTWYLVDTAQPLQVKAKTLLVSSPYVERYKEFRKTNAMIRFMPVWSKEDIDVCRKEFYNNPGNRYVSQENVDTLFKKWGGIPRYVLEKANIQSDQDELEIAISKCTTYDVMTYTGSEGAPEHISHKLLHMVVQRDPPEREDGIPPQLTDRYSKFQIDVASEYVARRLTDKFGSDSRHHLELLRSLQNRQGVPLLFGHLYENYAHQVIPRGGAFPTRNLSTGEEGVFHLEQKTTKLLSSVGDVSKVEDGEYGMGHNTFPGIDAVVRDPPSLFNMTVTRKEKRDLSDTTLKSVLDHLPETAYQRPCRYHWVMPTTKFATFQKQSVSGMRTKELDAVVEQFAMELSISEPVQKHSVEGANPQTAKRKQPTATQGGGQVSEGARGATGSGASEQVCHVILKTGRRKDKKCGRLRCPFHVVENQAKKPKR